MSKKIVFGTLMVMLILTILSIISGNDFTTYIVNESYTSVVNGTTTDYTIINEGFTLDAYAGAIGWLVVIVSIGVACGILVLGSGLSETSQHLLWNAIFYGAVWGIVSILPAPMIFSIEIFGGIIYITLTLIYVVAVLMTIGGSE